VLEQTPDGPPADGEAMLALLIARYLDGDLADEHVAALNSQLAAEEPARALFVRLARMHGLLTEHATTGREAAAHGWLRLADAAAEADEASHVAPSLHDAAVLAAIRLDEPPRAARVASVVERLPVAQPVVRAVAPSQQEPTAAPPTPRPRIGGRWPGGLAALVAIAIGAVVWERSRVAPVPSGPVATELQGAVTLGAAVKGDLRRADGRPVLPGDAVPSEPLELRAGWARLDFPGGATVVIEAPARLRVGSAREMALDAGRATAEVPPAAHGFTITAPACRVVDLGTEFGVDVGALGRTDVAVFRGVVSLNAGAPGNDAPQRVTEGQGRHVDAVSSPAVGADVVAGRFVRVGQFAEWAAAAAPAASPADRARAAEQQVCRDPTLALYYSFGDQASSPGVVVNRAASTAGRYDLPLAGDHAPTWAEGRLPGLSSLKFDPAKEQRLLLPEYPVTQTGQMTLAAWVYCNRARPWASIAKNWGVQNGGAFHLGLRDPQNALEVQLDDGIADATSNPVRVAEGADHPMPTGCWVHVAFTCDGRTATLYRDGHPVASGSCTPVAASSPIHSLAIGFKADDEGFEPSIGSQVGYWDGRMGSLALFHRALSDAEILQLFAASQPAASAH
jgi:hypothetical protein